MTYQWRDKVLADESQTQRPRGPLVVLLVVLLFLAWLAFDEYAFGGPTRSPPWPELRSLHFWEMLRFN